MLDRADVPLWEVTVRCVRGKVSVRPRVSDDVIIHNVVEGDVLEFIGRGGTMNWILCCELLQDWFEVITMHKTLIPRVNGMKLF